MSDFNKAAKVRVFGGIESMVMVTFWLGYGHC